MEPEPLCPGCFAAPAATGPCPTCRFDPGAPRPPNALPLGTLLNGQLVIGRVLGKPGGFGITYLAFDRNLKTRVAVKEYLPRDLATRGTDRTTILPHTEDEAGLFRYGLAQFLTEAQTLAQLDHPNVVRVRQFFEANRSAYLVMDYYPGVNLAEYLERQPGGRLPEATALALMQPILDGLRAVHAKGFLHRDIKPGNLYLAQTESGGARPILLDFGAARQAMGERSRSLSVVLSEGYAPFEQYHRRGEQGPWTDLYAVAAVLYRMLTGVTPEPATERLEADGLKPAVAFGVSGPVSDALMRALAMQPTVRPQTATQFQQWLAGDLTAVPRPGAAAGHSASPAERALGPGPGGGLPQATAGGSAQAGPADSSRDYRAVIGPRNTDFYLERFRRCDANGGKATAGWNWPCFLFGILWFLYRRMWLTGLAVFALSLLVEILIMVVIAALGSPDPLDSSASPLIRLPFGVLVGIYGNWLYYRRARSLIRKADAGFAGDAVARSGFLQARGGTGSAAIWIVIVAFIGILAAIAIPAYQDFILRAKVAEALTAMAPYKAAVAEYALANQAWPDSESDLDLAQQSAAPGIEIAVVANGMIGATFPEGSELAGKSIILMPRYEAGQVKWTCGSSDIKDPLLPAGCRQ